MVEGNHRLGAIAAEFFLALGDTVLECSHDELVDIPMGTAEGRISTEVIAIWIRQRSREIES